MYAIIRYCMEDVNSDIQLDVVGVALNSPDAEEMLACQVDNDFDDVEDIYGKVFQEWEWDMNDMMKDEKLMEELEEHFFMYHIKICEL